MTAFNQKQLEAIKSQEPEIVILAPAGSGKTTTLVGAIIEYKKNNPYSKVVAITFTKKAADDLQTRLIDFSGIRVSTIHSWAYSELEFLAKKVRDKNPNNAFKVKLLEEERIKEILMELATKRKYRYIKIWELYSYTMGNYNIDVSENMKRLFEVVKSDYIKYKEDYGLYDFTDLPQYLLDKLNDYDEQIQNIDALFVDEFQDVDDIQIELFDRVPAVKKFYIGDPQQCQPSGTKIRMADGTQKNIEDIKIGDMVVSYSASNGFITGCGHGSTGYKISNKSSREFVNDELITIELENGLKSSYTPNHKTIVSLVENEYNYVTYLMCDKNERFRVGMSMIFVNNKGIDMVIFRKKMRDEKCINLWILNVFKTEKEARVLEDKISYLYNIPQNTFQLDKTSYTKEDIDYIYENLNTKNSAIKCLKDFHRDINFPLIYEGFNGHFARNGSAQIYAINLMPNIMKAMCHNPSGVMKPITNKYYSIIKNVKREFINNPIMVYSLEVDKYEHYIADNIVTHNSIYIFRGATPDILKRLDDFKQHNLVINYRSYQEIIDFASSIQMKAMQEQTNFTSEKESMRSRIECIKGYGGEVYSLNASGMAFKINEYLKRDGLKVLKEFINRNSMILCRKNRQVKEIKDMGYPNVSTVHQAKGLEYPSVIVTDFPIGPEDLEEVNIAYVAMTRAENHLLVADYGAFVMLLEKLIPEYRKTRNLF